MKRFYDAVEVAEVSGGFAVALDGKTVNTPGRAKLGLPNAALAEAVASEWRAQGEQVDPHTMRLTRLANTAIDRVAGRREQVISEITGFAANDLLCYRAAAPPELVARQSAAWQPVLDWAEHRHGVRLMVTTGVSHVDQPDESLHALTAAVARFDDFALAALHSATAASGSAVIGLALAEAEIDAEAAWACTDLDDAWQAERWGADDEADRRRRALQADLLAASRFLTLGRSPA
jgi:chaperone required for assembly of F1-ATPase